MEEEPENQENKDKCINYHYIDDPFWDENEERDLVLTVSPSGEPEILEEGLRSSEWNEWEKAIKMELDQLTQMGHGYQLINQMMLFLYPINGYF